MAFKNFHSTFTCHVLQSRNVSFCYRATIIIILTVLALIPVPQSAEATLMLPGNLSSSDRKTALETVGFASASKILSDPYSLGGFWGLELGISVEIVPTEELSTLGDRLANKQNNITVPKFTLGKGLYSNFDFFIHFTPYNQQNQLSEFGSILRWSFFEAATVPISTSILVHMNMAEFTGQLATQTYGVDLMGGINVNQVSLYSGVGLTQAAGTFIGGPNGVTDTHLKERESAKTVHIFAGGALQYDSFFIAVQLDRYIQSVMSAKVGIRY